MSLIGVSTRADWFGFDSVTTNAPTREVVGSQLFMETTMISTSSSSVLFTNAGPVSSSISEIYFGSHLTTLNLAIDSILSSSPGVQYDISGAHPANPPGWNEMPNWWSVTIAAAESDAPASGNGINPLEYLELELSYADSLSLSEMIQSGDLLVALHVIDMGGFSDTFVVPEPTSLVLIGSSAAFLAVLRRRIHI